MSEMFGSVVLAFVVILFGYVYKAVKPPPPKICGSPSGPSVTSLRVKLKDGRHLAYREAGVSKEDAKHKIIIVHGFNSSKDMILPVSQELIEELKIYLLFFDKAGYGEIDPYPKRYVKSEADDIEELADNLQLGSKFYVVGISMGAYPVWSCINYIPQRLAGISLVVPFVHYWWPCFPSSLSTAGFKKLPARDQWALRVAHYAPWLFYWWMTQKWIPSLSILSGNLSIYGPHDLEIIKKLSEVLQVGQGKTSQQGVYESLHRDIIAGYAKWEFHPLDIRNPFPENEGSVHIWQGYEDRIIPRDLNRFISEKLPWIKYHEVPDGGHLMVYDQSVTDSIIRSLLFG